MKAWRDLTDEEKFARQAAGEEVLFWWCLLLTAAVTGIVLYLVAS